jgi:hypothetical protein
MGRLGAIGPLTRRHAAGVAPRCRTLHRRFDLPRAAYPGGACGDLMAKQTRRPRKRSAKARPSETDDRSVEQIAAELWDDPALQAAWDAAYPPKPSRVVADFFENAPDLGPKVDPFESKEHCRSAAIRLFLKIKEHHGGDAAKHIFTRLGKPSKKQSKGLEDSMLWTNYQIIKIHNRNQGITMTEEEIYEKLHKLFPRREDGGGGTTAGIKRRLLELRKKPPK